MSGRNKVWRYLRGLLAPLLLWGLFVAVLLRLLPSWMRGDDDHDEKALKEWLDEAGARDNLPKMVRDYLDAVAAWRRQYPDAELSNNLLLRLQAEKIQEQLQSMGDPPTKMYPGQLILFPTIYRMEVRFDSGLKLPPIAWDSDLPRHPSQYRTLEYQFTDGATVLVQFQLHVYKKRQRIEQEANFRLRWVSLLAVAGTVLAFSWVYLVQRRESERDRQRVEERDQCMSEKRRITTGSTSLKKLADHLGLNPATVSVVLNEVPGRSIPQVTRDRIKAAARELNYHPSLLARSLRNRRTLTVGILVPDLSEAYHNQVVNSIGDHLMEAGYFYFTAHHRRRVHLVEEYSRMLLGRGAEALIAIDTPLEHPFSVPVVAVAGHRPIPGVTNVILDHRFAAELVLTHLRSLGHRRIVFVRGQSFSADATERWRHIVDVAQEIGIPIRSELIVQLDRDLSSPELGYPVIQQLLANRARFTAVVAFNDLSAIGAIRALQDFGIRVPADVSVIGFDDIDAAAFNNPRLTTIRQPLAEMGRLAAQCVLNRLHGTKKFLEQITVEPQLMVRESTQAIRQKNPAPTGKKSKVPR